MTTPEEFADNLRNADFDKRRLMSRIVFTVEGNSKREAPVRTGTLRRSITSRVEDGGNTGRVGTNLPYARPVHEGQRPHVIRPRNKRALFWSGARHPVAYVNHPGAPGNPFFERGLKVSDPTIRQYAEEAGHEYFGRIG